MTRHTGTGITRPNTARSELSVVRRRPNENAPPNSECRAPPELRDPKAGAVFLPRRSFDAQPNCIRISTDCSGVSRPQSHVSSQIDQIRTTPALVIRCCCITTIFNHHSLFLLCASDTHLISLTRSIACAVQRVCICFCSLVSRETLYRTHYIDSVIHHSFITSAAALIWCCPFAL